MNRDYLYIGESNGFFKNGYKYETFPIFDNKIAVYDIFDNVQWLNKIEFDNLFTNDYLKYDRVRKINDIL